MKMFRTIASVTAVLAFTSAYLIPTVDDSNQPASHSVLSEKELTTQLVDETTPIVKTEDIQLVDGPIETLEPEKIQYTVKPGDTLSNIFSQLEISLETLQHILSVDLNHLRLDTIKPGEQLEFVVSSNNELLSMIYHISLVEHAVYTKEQDGSFSYQLNEIPGEWREKLFSGTITGSFSVSANKLGLTSNQIGNITRVLHDKIDFSRSLHAGDRFNILVKQQFLHDRPTGNSEIQAISFTFSRGLSKREVSAFLAPDGRFYDREGNSLERAFNRYPVDKKYRRITSSFNPRRKHPVTGRISPHNGTDFGTPVGAPVYSTGDGKVIGLRNHPYAGKYLVIQHNSVYKTRYLHLSKFLVKNGQQITRGQKIALAGATGRLTGPHLHFEVLVRNRAVDAMKADLPIATTISQKDKDAFYASVSAFDSLVNNS
ncbi:peptidoglycan DD-metalloendopeptidase family protein [Vibrio sp. WJH972]